MMLIRIACARRFEMKIHNIGFYEKMSQLIPDHYQSGLLLCTKLCVVSGTTVFPNWLKKFLIDLKHSQLAEKSQLKMFTFPMWQKLDFFSPISLVPKIFQKVEKKPCQLSSDTSFVRFSAALV